MELMKKGFLPLIFAALIVVFLISSTNAYMQANSNTLDVSVSSNPEVISLGGKVTIDCTTNMDGKGIVFVIEPVNGSSLASSESRDIRQDLDEISHDMSLKRVISYAWVIITNSEGGSRSFTFPDDFTGLNGEPSTNTFGKYYVFFIFIHLCVCKIDFDCSSFFSIPELPFGSLMATTASFGALLGLVAVKRLRTKRSLPSF